MSDTLNKIAAKVRERLEEEKTRRPRAELERQAARTMPGDFRARLKSPAVNVISEVKFASPSEGVFPIRLSALEVAEQYIMSGAAALSVLTERDFFNGDPAYISAIRSRHPESALLMKDFVVDEYQLLRARADGADAVLLIMALLGRARAQELLAQASAHGLQALVEVHDDEELCDAFEIGATIVGVNNRSLKTLKVDLSTSERLIATASGLLGERMGQVAFVCESGLSQGQQLQRLKRMGFDAFLVGSHFMRTGTPGRALRLMLEEAT